MTPEERERLKEAEKAHLRQLRALKQQYREAQRKKGLLDALQGMVRPDLDEIHEEMVDKLSRQNIEAEARFEVAMEDAGLTEDPLERAAREAAEREALRTAEADALVRQMKQEMGGGEAARPETATPTGAKSIGRPPAPDAPEAERPEVTKPDEPNPEAPLGPKSIGRPRRTE